MARDIDDFVYNNRDAWVKRVKEKEGQKTEKSCSICVNNNGDPNNPKDACAGCGADTKDGFKKELTREIKCKGCCEFRRRKDVDCDSNFNYMNCRGPYKADENT